MQIRITDKLRKALSLKASDLESPTDDTTVMGCWYANLFTLERRKSIIFVNEKTLFSFVLIGLKKSNLDIIDEAFKMGLAQALQVNGFHDNEIAQLISDIGNISFTKTTNKSAIGSMVDLLYIFESFLYNSDNELDEIIRKLNMVPHVKRDPSFAVHAVRNLLVQAQPKM